MLPGSSLSLSITQQFGKLGLNITKPTQEIRQPQADMQITQTPAKMTIDGGPGKLHVDGAEARAALGLKPTLRMMTDVSAQVRQIVLEAIGDIASEGDQMANFNQTSVADIALQRQEAGLKPIRDYGGFSYDNVDVSYDAYPFKIDWEKGGADITVTPQKAEHTYTPGKVEIYVAQQNSLQIEPKGQYMNMTF